MTDNAVSLRCREKRQNRFNCFLSLVCYCHPSCILICVIISFLSLSLSLSLHVFTCAIVIHCETRMLHETRRNRKGTRRRRRRGEAEASMPFNPSLLSRVFLSLLMIITFSLSLAVRMCLPMWRWLCLLSPTIEECSLRRVNRTVVIGRSHFSSREKLSLSLALYERLCSSSRWIDVCVLKLEHLRSPVERSTEAQCEWKQ